MELFQFQDLKEKFKNGSTEEKIGIYTGAEDLSQSQYRELLKLFPLNEIDKLEKALQS